MVPIRAFVASGLVLFAFLYVAACLHGCARPMTPQEKAVVAESTYAAELLKCVDDSSTLAESKICRSNVRARWDVDGGAR